MTPEVVGFCRLRLGEGPIWDKRRNLLFCVDIERHEVLRINAETGQFERWRVPGLPASLGLCRSGRLVIGKKDGVFLAGFRDDGLEFLCNPIAQQPSARLNDGKVAPDGSFWVGSMQNNVAGDGAAIDVTTSVGGFYRIDKDGRAEQLIDSTLGIANTLAWSPDQSHFIFADSLKGVLYRSELDSGRCAKTTVFNADFKRGIPDGSAMDAEGFLWNCRWGGRCVVRFAPDGQVDQVVEFPATNITSCAFGGAKNNILFVTSAQSGLTKEQLNHNPLEGAVFAMETPVPGMDVPLFAD